MGTLALSVALVASACSSSESDSDPAATTAPQTASPSSPSSEGPPRVSTPVDPSGAVEGLVDVDGHDLYVRCVGRGSPTVVYLHGWIPEPGTDNGATTALLEAELNDFRFCSYHRRNTQRSESVSGSQRPEDVVADLAGVMNAVNEEGPFLLLGASFGGLVAHAFAVSHPDDVAGIVMLDAAIGDEVLIDRLKPPPFRASSQENQQFDAHDSLERINGWRLYRWIYSRRHREPEVPLIYLASAQDKATVHPDFSAPKYDARYYPTYKAFAARWSPGKFAWVNAPHFMEPVIPGTIADAVREVVRLAREN